MNVSVLLSKLKERHKEYILVSETLELMSQANENCPLDHVKTYLLSNDIHYHMPVFYLDDYFKIAIDPSEESIRNFDGFGSTHHELTNDKVSDDAYFLIELLNDFEPIQEFDIFAYKRGYHYIANHSVGKFTIGEKVIGLTEGRAIELLETGAIKKQQINNENVVRQSKAPPPPNHINIAPTSQKTIDKVIEAEKSQDTNSIVNDVYGRTYDINQHKKNREDDYLTLGETLDFLNHNTDVNTSSYDHVKIRDIARRKLIAPCFYFDGYVGGFRGGSDDGFYTEVIAGYFTYRSLAEEICRYGDHMKLPNDGVMIYSILEKKTAEFVDNDNVFLFYDKPQGLNEAERFKLAHIDADEIRFSKRALNSYIASLTNTSQDDTPAQSDSELLIKLESAQTENDKLNARLNKASEIYRQNQSEIKELKSQLEKANADRAELKEQLSNKIDAPADDTILQTILDDSRGDHAPDLKHAIQLWIDLYIHGGIKDDSHSSKANIWIRSNTNYAENANSSIGRIREIATPLKDFGAKRSREEEK